MNINDPVFREPNRVAGFYEVVFPDGPPPEGYGLQGETGIAFDMRTDQPHNRVELDDGNARHLRALETTADGSAVAR